MDTILLHIQQINAELKRALKNDFLLHMTFFLLQRTKEDIL